MLFWIIVLFFVAAGIVLAWRHDRRRRRLRSGDDGFTNDLDRRSHESEPRYSTEGMSSIGSAASGPVGGGGS